MSVHRAATGRWLVKFREGGRSRTLTVSSKNLLAFGLQAPATEKKVTKRHANALDAEVQRRLLATEVQPTTRRVADECVEEAVERYLEQLQASELHKANKRRWLQGTEGTSGRAGPCPGLTELVGNVDVRDVTADDIIAFREHLAQGGYEANTTLNALRAVRSFFNWCLATGRCEANPARAVPLPSAEPAMPKVLTPEECKQLLAKASGLRIERVFRLILGLGLRRQEAQALHWEDIDGERRVVVIRRKLKTPRARREIPLPSKLLSWLLPEVGTYVLQTDAGEAYSSPGLATMLARFKRDAELPFDVTFRVCRATYGSFLVSQGFELAEVSRFLGHSSVTLTERWYYGLRPSRFADRVDDAFDDGLL